MTETHELYIEREFKASPAELFQAWTNPQAMTQWMAPAPVQCKEVQLDLKVGGSYRIHMVSEEGDHIATGKYLEIQPEKKLVFTWGWEGGEVKGTKVTVSFEFKGGKTHMGILHEDFPSASAAEKHTEGWKGCLVKLERTKGVK